MKVVFVDSAAVVIVCCSKVDGPFCFIRLRDLSKGTPQIIQFHLTRCKMAL